MKLANAIASNATLEQSEPIHSPPARASVPALSLSGAEIIVRALERHDVRVIVGIPGGALLPLYEALARCTRIRHVLARHEQAAGFIAQGMARMTRRAGVCLATSGPGVTNIVTALADAKLDSIPLVCITGQVPTHLIGTDAFQEVATVDLVKPITKAAFFAKSAKDLAALIDQAFLIAESGRPGPVLIDVPKDVQLQKAEVDCNGRLFESSRTEPMRMPRIDSAYDDAAKLIADAEKPVLYLGGGVVKSKAERLACRFAELNGIPVVTTLMALGTLPHDHTLNLGMLGMHGSRATHYAVHECDLLIAVGARFDDRATGNPKHFAPHAKIIHADIDSREFGKIKTPTIALHADAWTALTQLLKRPCHRDRTSWLRRAESLRSKHSFSANDAIRPHAFVRAIGERIAKDTIVTTDVGQHQMWVAQVFPFTRADRWLTSGGLGTMGFGLPAAIGALLAEPEAKAVCFTGDGSLLMNIQELATLAELKLPVKIVLFDNRSLGMVRQQQELFFDGRFLASHFEQPSDFLAIARAFGLDAIDVGSIDDIESNREGAENLTSVLASPRPALIRIAMREQYNVSPMVGPGSANIEALDC